MLKVWVNPVAEFHSENKKFIKAEIITHKKENKAPITMELHRNFVQLNVVNTARYENGPLPFLAPAHPRKISTAPARRSRTPSYASSNSTPVTNFINSSDLASYVEGDNSNASRHTSSSSSTSLALERKHNSKSPHHSNRHRSIRNGTRSHDRHTEADSLPVVCTDENINTSVHMLPINVRQSRSHQQIMQQSSPAGIFSNGHKNHTSISPKTQHINSLSISGIKQDGGASSNSRGEDTTPDEDDGQHNQLQINDKLEKLERLEKLDKIEKTERIEKSDRMDKLERMASKPAPSQSSNTYGNSTSSSAVHQPQTGASNGGIPQYLQPSKRRQIKSQTSSSSGRTKQKADPEPKYADPVAGATTSFQSRLAELASLEAETVRWERLRKLKKKARDD